MKALAIIPALFAVTLAQADIVARDVEYKEGSTTCQGYVAFDAKLSGKAPVVMVVHDWNGIDDYEKMRCRMLAELGYVAVAVDIYGKGVRPANPTESGAEAGKYYSDNALLRKRLQAGLTFAGGLVHADKSRMAVIGYCFGGMAALEVARMGAPVKGVASFHGSLGTAHPAKAGAIKAEVLVLHGDADPMVPIDQVNGFKREMKDAGAKLKFVAYPGAVHAFTVKGSERAGMNGVGYQKDADERSWDEMKAFFARIFKS